MKTVIMEKREFVIILFCTAALFLLLGNMWGSSATRKTVATTKSDNLKAIETKIEDVRQDVKELNFAVFNNPEGKKNEGGE
jgi:hypothetical protein